MARPIVRAERSSPAPSTLIAISFCAPSPSLTTWRARSCATSVRAARKPASRGSSASTHGRMAGRAGGEQKERVRGRGVAVDRDGVEGPIRDFSDQRSCQRSAASTASVTTKASMVAMSGAIMPGALGDAGDGYRARRRCRQWQQAPLAKVSVVMIARAASAMPWPVKRRHEVRHPGGDPLDRQPLADHAGRGHQHLPGARSRGRLPPPRPRPAPPRRLRHRGRRWHCRH